VTTEVARAQEPGAPPTRSPAELISDQLRGIAAWHDARRALEEAHAAAGSGQPLSREMRLDLDRQVDVVRRQHEAMLRRLDEHLAAGPRLPRSAAGPRAVLVHRNEWFLGKLVDGLRGGGVDIVALLENGADAVGVAVAEQPDLLFVEDKLPMISGPEVLRQVARFAPGTVTAAQVEHEGAVTDALEVGARAAFARRVPPADVARELCRLVCG
jgi:hypothetical protein